MHPTRQSPPPSERDADGAERFRRLHALGRVGLRAETCLHVHRTYLDCNACVQHCPHHCLTRGEGALAFDHAQCTACGICVAHCPTGALSVEGHGLTSAPADTPLVVTCERARLPARDLGMATRRVPCLGGLHLNDYLRAFVANGGAPIIVADDGACATCPTARGRGNPGLRALAEARRAIAATGAGNDELPQHLLTAALPDGNGALQAASGSPSPGRRAFLSGLSRALAGRVTGSAATSAPPRQPRATMRGMRGDDTYVLLDALARRYGRAAPREALLPQLAASEHCCAHGTCAQVCPTGALELAHGQGQATLRFDPWQCVACGACARTCPEQALQQTAPAWDEFTDRPMVLAQVMTKECVRCGALLAAHDDNTLCDRCDKTRRLAQAGFALFNPHKRVSSATPGLGSPGARQSIRRVDHITRPLEES